MLEIAKQPATQKQNKRFSCNIQKTPQKILPKYPPILTTLCPILTSRGCSSYQLPIEILHKIFYKNTKFKAKPKNTAKQE